ncbi:signal transduction histidine kinase [Diaminobutyricimonas aerilata]|uniref:histidine kinase n=1 Tax=Diaminobutyricimonas aerilata TaxID=1162967 RepID=A0A2M9CF98_9MICO|nr:sensor histidine kinase [Diaminobutyricimonas aerilata]PJJ70559.1 signal transduction histidine kinase [Diaminobutyricimonas aerilata]
MRTDTRRSRATARLRRVIPVLAVAVLAVGTLVADVVVRASPSATLEDYVLPDGYGWMCAVLVLLQAAVLWWRGPRPALALVATTVLDIAIMSLTSGELGMGAIAVMVAVVAIRQRLDTRPALLWVAASAAASAIAGAIALASSDVVPGEWSFALALTRVAITFVAPALIAEVTISRRRMLEALRERAALAERDRERSAREAVQQERALMARELHDIAAHHLSGIIVGSQAAGALLAREPDRAREYLRGVTTEAQETLANLRQTVGLLRPDQQGELGPQPALDRLPELVDGLRASGMTVVFEQSGEPVPLGPVAEIAAYRMVQESLTNARRHAPGAPCDVTVRYGSDSVELSVTNAPSGGSVPTEGGGNGLLGMRERAALTGSTLHAGATPDGGWRNVLVVPYPSTNEESA